MFFIVPVLNGIMDIDYNFVEYSHITTDAAYVKMREGYTQRASWVQITEEQFETYKPPAMPYSPPQSQGERITQLEEIIDTLLVGGIAV